MMPIDKLTTVVELLMRAPMYHAAFKGGHDSGDEDPGEPAQRRVIWYMLIWYHQVSPWRVS